MNRTLEGKGVVQEYEPFVMSLIVGVQCWLHKQEVAVPVVKIGSCYTVFVLVYSMS